MSAEVKGFEFGDFFLDCDEQALHQDGKPVALTPKAYLLLKTLVENHGRIIEKSELMETVWPDSFVEESNLPFTAYSLRKKLGDNKDEPRFIETVPRRGYRFVAPVTPILKQPVSDAEDGLGGERVPEPLVELPWWRRRASLAAAAVAAILVVSGGIWFVTRAVGRNSASILSRSFSVEQLSTSGNSARAAISPDGKYAVYSDEAGGKQSLWLRNLDSSENVQIVPPSEDEYLGLTFSNSGKAVYFVRLPNGVHALPGLYRIETMGGVPAKLADNVNRRVSVSHDDTRIAFPRCVYRKVDFCSLIVADADGKNERRLMDTENGVHIWDARFSPDGRTIAAAVGRSFNDTKDSNIIEIDVESGERKDLFTERFAEVASLEWVPDGTGIIFSASDFLDGKSSVYLADRKTGQLEQLTRDAASYQTLSLDGAAGQMIAIQQVPDFRLHVVTNGVTEKHAVARDMSVVPGGKVIYSTFDGEVWSLNPDGSEQRQLTKSRNAETSVRVSPDGKWIFFSSDESGNRQVWRMASDGSERTQLTHSVGGFPLAVSSDGQYVFYEATLDSRLHKVAADGSGEAQISDKLLRSPSISPDGTRVAYFYTEAMVRKLAIMDLGTGQNVKVLDAPQGSLFTRNLAWSADGTRVNYVTIADGRNTLWETKLDPEPPHKLADLGDGFVQDISAAENGNFAYIIGNWRFDVMLVRGLA